MGKAKKALVKKAAAKKVVAKKVAPKKAVAKKAAPKKVVAKKAAPKKVVTKKAVAKKPVVKKVEVKKASTLKNVLKNTKKLAGKVIEKISTAKAVPKKEEKVKGKKETAQIAMDLKSNKDQKGKKTKGKIVEEEKNSKGKSDKNSDDDDDLKSDKKSKDEDFLLGDADFEGEELDLDFEEEMRSKDYEPIIKGKLADEILRLIEHFNWRDIHDAICSLEYFIDTKSDECMEKGCDNLRATQGYCRLHYIKNYKTLKKKKEILKEGKLQEYITELFSKYPPKLIEQMLQDLSDDREFYRVLNDLGITSNFNYEEFDSEETPEDEEDVMSETRGIVGRVSYDDEEM